MLFQTKKDAGINHITRPMTKEVAVESTLHTLEAVANFTKQVYDKVVTDKSDILFAASTPSELADDVTNVQYVTELIIGNTLVKD